jgi:hypothetical protein
VSSNRMWRTNAGGGAGGDREGGVAAAGGGDAVVSEEADRGREEGAGAGRGLRAGSLDGVRIALHQAGQSDGPNRPQRERWPASFARICSGRPVWCWRSRDRARGLFVAGTPTGSYSPQQLAPCLTEPFPFAAPDKYRPTGSPPVRPTTRRSALTIDDVAVVERGNAPRAQTRLLPCAGNPRA